MPRDICSYLPETGYYPAMGRGDGRNCTMKADKVANISGYNFRIWPIWLEDMMWYPYIAKVRVSIKWARTSCEEKVSDWEQLG